MPEQEPEQEQPIAMRVRSNASLAPSSPRGARSARARASVLGLAAFLAVSLGCGGGGGSGGGAALAQSSGASSPPAPAAPTTQPGSAFYAFEAVLGAIASQPAVEQQRQIDAFVSAQRGALEGFPLLLGERARFLYRATSTTAGPYHVAGSWNGWSTQAEPLARIGGTTYWSAVVRIPGGGRHEYKFVEQQGARWLADPLNRKFTYDNGNSVVQLGGSGPGAQASHLERWPQVPSSQLANARDVFVYLPPGALFDGQRYPVVYMHDGQNLFDPGAFFGGWRVDAALDAEIAAGRIEKTIVVALANTPGRMNEYTHVPDVISSNCSGAAIGGQADAYLSFIVDELKPAIDRIYPTRTERDSTAILGSSLGGLVSLYAGIRYPHVFGHVGGMSSTLGWGDFCQGNPRVFDLAQAAGKLPIRVYLDSGGVGPSSPSSDNWGVTEELKLLLEQQGYRLGVDLLYWWEPSAPHNEAAWRARVARPLRFFFPR